VYQYCSSHHAGDTRSVTERAFLGSVRNRSSGDLVSGSNEVDTVFKAVSSSRVVSLIWLLARRLNVSQTYHKRLRLIFLQSVNVPF
jgi:hypothetical protein